MMLWIFGIIFLRKMIFGMARAASTVWKSVWSINFYANSQTILNQLDFIAKKNKEKKNYLEKMHLHFAIYRAFIVRKLFCFQL